MIADVYTYQRWHGRKIPVFEQGSTFMPSSILMKQAREMPTTVTMPPAPPASSPLSAPARPSRICGCVCALQGRTTAPELLKEEDLISLMHKEGIGTDATIAEHITTIQKRNYAEKVRAAASAVSATLPPALEGTAHSEEAQSVCRRLAAALPPPSRCPRACVRVAPCCLAMHPSPSP